MFDIKCKESIFKILRKTVKQGKSPKQLAKLISYMLGRKPEEFGLAPDPEGFVKVKDLLKAVCEEDGWKYVRRSHLQEVLITLPEPPFEIDDNLIRAKDRSNLPVGTPSENPPKLLYTCVRERAYHVVSEKGVSPTGNTKVVLSTGRVMAERMGMRFDRTPVMLIVNTAQSIKKGVRFVQTGEGLFVADSIPLECFSGPPVPKQKAEPAKPAEPEVERTRKQPGSFFMDIHPVDTRAGMNFRKPGGRRDPKEKIAKEKAIKQRRRKKQKMWEP